MNEETEIQKNKKNVEPGKENHAGAGGEKLVNLRESDYQKLVEEANGYKDKYLRLYAEFENARKRMEREKSEFLKYANEELIKEFLGVLDNLELSVNAALAKHEDYAAFLKGVEMIMANIYELLRKNDVKPIQAVNQIFDPNCHEVLMQEESDKHPDRAVIEEFQKGYTFGDRVIRTAKVKVARKKEGQP